MIVLQNSFIFKYDLNVNLLLKFRMTVFCHDQTSKFVFILSHGQRSRQYILPEDLVSLVQDVVDTHPGLAFLKEAAEFHSRYGNFCHQNTMNVFIKFLMPYSSHRHCTNILYGQSKLVGKDYYTGIETIKFVAGMFI